MTIRSISHWKYSYSSAHESKFCLCIHKYAQFHISYCACMFCFIKPYRYWILAPFSFSMAGRRRPAVGDRKMNSRQTRFSHPNYDSLTLICVHFYFWLGSPHLVLVRIKSFLERDPESKSVDDVCDYLKQAFPEYRRKPQVWAHFLSLYPRFCLRIGQGKQMVAGVTVVTNISEYSVRVIGAHNTNMHHDVAGIRKNDMTRRHLGGRWIGEFLFAAEMSSHGQWHQK